MMGGGLMDVVEEAEKNLEGEAARLVCLWVVLGAVSEHPGDH